VAKARKVKTKAKCCKSKQRCKRCAVVCKRLEKRGLAERVGKRRYVLLPALTKGELAAARVR
jgi:predicted transcriptional regulator of viral defense system